MPIVTLENPVTALAASPVVVMARVALASAVKVSVPLLLDLIPSNIFVPLIELVPVR